MMFVHKIITVPQSFTNVLPLYSCYCTDAQQIDSKVRKSCHDHVVGRLLVDFWHIIVAHHFLVHILLVQY